MLRSSIVHSSLQPLLDGSRYPRTYRTSRGYRIFLSLLGVLIMVPACLGIWYFGTGHETQGARDTVMMVSVCFLFVLLGAYLIGSLLRFQVTLRADAIEVQNCFTSRTLPRAEIEGFRILPTQYVATMVLIPRESHQKKLKFSQMLRTDDAFKEWFAGLRNLDTAELAESKAQLEADLSAEPSAGPTTEVAADRLAQAKKVANAATVAAFAAMVWGWFFPRPYPVVIAVLGALPLVAIVLLARSRGIYQIEGRRNDAHPSLAVVFLLPTVTLALRAIQDVQLLEWKPLLSRVILGALVLTAIIARSDRGLRVRYGVILLFFVFSAVYAYGAIVQANALLDNSAPQTYEVVVTGKHVTTGRSTTYYLRLAAWGPQTDASDVTVGRRLYNVIEPGQTVCADLRAGALRIPWYTVFACR